jgi:hypothetical protein
LLNCKFRGRRWPAVTHAMSDVRRLPLGEDKEETRVSLDELGGRQQVPTAPPRDAMAVDDCIDLLLPLATIIEKRVTETDPSAEIEQMILWIRQAGSGPAIDSSRAVQDLL